MRRAILILLASLVAGCTNQLAARQAYLNQFIGRSESDLVQQMGVPTRSFETGGVQYLAYNESRTDVMPGLPGYGWGPYWGWYGGGIPPQVVTLTCETTFAVSNGVVQSYTLRGNACG